MLSAFVNVFKIGDLRKKLLLTLGLIAVYRIGTYIPTPGVDGYALSQFLEQAAKTQGGMGTVFGLMNMFSGGAMHKLTIFALGIMPYISASIILQLLTTVIPQLERMAKEGEMGRKKLTQYTRYGTVLLSIVQSFFIALWLEHPRLFGNTVVVPEPGWGFRILCILTLTSGTAFIMWLGEQITERGIGNGMSLIIAAGIVSRIPTAIHQTYILLSPSNPDTATLGPLQAIFMLMVLIAVIASVILVTQGQRKIPVQYAKRVVGRRVFSGQSTYIPLRVNQAGVIPIIFAVSILMFPQTFAALVQSGAMQRLASHLTEGRLLYNIFYALLIIFFTYFYTAITFNPLDISENMKKSGAFVPGIRPGQATTDFLGQVMNRITFSGAVFLAIIAIMPDIIYRVMDIPYLVASFFGGTALLIVVGVMLDSMRQLESQLLMRHYDGFMKKGRIKGRY
ncbi:MAG: preprotein translocase subunit SecY [Chlamydiae bacterium]|nr:preprotein translocase subunit SecY [Chlamydiota bacterium]MBI3276993.1 preprotein translocase subunit SecY [Chlamydiota bacterium]